MFEPPSLPLLPLRSAEAPPLYSVTALSRYFNLEFERASSPRPDFTGGAWGIHWWLVREDVPVAYCKTVFDPRESQPHILMEIEVRERFRGMGLTRMLTTAVTDAAGLQLHSTGNWTPSGARALASLPLIPGYDAGVHHVEAAYVRDWDSRQARYF